MVPCFLDNSGMLEIPIKGGSFTWSNQRCDEEAILEKIDRILSSVEWSLAFPKAIGVLEVPIASHHTYIILLLPYFRKKTKKDFKFESKWLLEDECFSNAKGSWESGEHPINPNSFVTK
ncbi:hypothetical protein V6N12_065152 [Hibiscus sabdariffa]|uniref:Uncharacterized protein n=1 Tax=Hibiscus sabdariffa TaxID=183260 RepID=A0ABR2G7V6_9ROSI